MSRRQPNLNSTIGIWAYIRTPTDNFGGVETYVMRIAQDLIKRGAKVVLHCLANSDAGWNVVDQNFTQGTLEYKTADGMTVVIPENGPGFQGALMENVRAAKSAREDIILAFGTRDGFVFSSAQCAAEELGIPLVSFVYFTSEERMYRSQYASRTRSIAGIADQTEIDQLVLDSEQVIESLVSSSALVITPTNYVKSQIQKIIGYESENIDVVYHGVDDSAIGRVDSANRRGLVHISRLSLPFAAHKNFFWTLEFARYLHRLNRLDQLTVVGDGGGREVAEIFANKNRLQSHVTFSGALRLAEVAALLRRTRVLLVPSMMEAGSTTTMDAVMAGCVPIGAAAGALPELFEDLGLSEYLVETSECMRGRIRSIEPSVEHASEILTMITEQPDATNAAMIRAQHIARERFGLSATTTQLLETLWQRNLVQ